MNSASSGNAGATGPRRDVAVELWPRQPAWDLTAWQAVPHEQADTNDRRESGGGLKWMSPRLL